MVNEIKKEFDLNKILEEDYSFQKILLPTINQPFKEKSKGYYIFENKEEFRGKIINNILQKGKYNWPNGQIFFGDLSDNNRFNKKGKIIFPNKDELIGKFQPYNNTIEKAIYKTKKRIFHGSFKNNRLHGKFIIKNNENMPHYLFIGSYINGIKDGNFILETFFNSHKIEINGAYNKGKKNGVFKIYFLKEKNVDEKKVIIKEFIDEFNFKNDLLLKKQDEILKKKSIEFNEKYKEFNCMKIIKEAHRLYLLIGSKELLLIYYINEEENTINFDRSFSLFKNEEINDILELKDGKLLLCSNNNNLKLIEISFKEKEKNNITNVSTSHCSENDFIIFQEFKGLKNSNSIYTLIELTNELIVSGDCQNIIVWKKSYLNNEIGNNSFINDNSNINNDYSINIFTSEKVSSHTYCILEIKNENNKIILAVAQPDSKEILFFQISPEDKIIKIASINDIETIQFGKHIMTIINNDLLVGSINKVFVIDIKKYIKTNKIYIHSKINITYINYFNKYLLLGLMIETNSNKYEGYVSKKEFVSNSPNKKANIVPILDYKEVVHNGNIIDIYGYKFDNNTKEGIISISKNGKILLLV